MAPPKPPPIKSSRTSGAEQAAAEVIALLESLHAKIDGLPKCECSALRQELSEMKILMGKTVEPSPTSTDDTYSAVKKALNDAAVFADKSMRAVWVGRPECNSPEETAKGDQKALEELCAELNDSSISQALKEGKITHHRHPQIKGERKRRIVKIGFPDSKMRDRFLSISRTTHPTTVSKQPGNFLRRDLCPFELELERKARINAYVMNCKIGALAYGIRDEKLIKFNGLPRPLPSGYENRPPRGFAGPSINSSVFFQSNANASFDQTASLNSSGILANLPPMPSTSTTVAPAKASGAGMA